jgi:hypothetical protein
MKISILSVCLLAFLFTFSTQTFAVDFTVNLTTDQHDASLADGVCDINSATVELECSLRAAVEQANVLASNDRILFNLPVNSTITLTIANGGQIPINNNPTLEIIETTTSNLRISGNNTSSVFGVSPGGNLTINGVTITNGRAGISAGIQNSGTLTVTNSTFSGNTAADGGCIQNNGTLTVTNSTFSGNTALSVGGCILNAGTLTVTNSTFSGNTAANSGGGIYNNGTMTMTNSTVSGNTAGRGGGISNNGDSTLNLTSVTVTNNRATRLSCDFCGAGGINNFGGTANLNNTIVAGNFNANASVPPDFDGEVSSTSSYNIIGNGLGTTGITNGTNGNQVGTPANPINPLLAPLANNGGQTQTHALLVGSPAIDAGLNTLVSEAFDQRGTGFLRIRDGNGDGTAIVDIGAFEVQLAPTAASVSVSGRVKAGRRGVSNAVVQLTSQSGEIQTARTNFFGYYSFRDLAAGETYIINVYSKRYQFNPQVVNLTEDLDELNFTAQ